MNRAVFLDRDGVINQALVIGGKPYSPKTIKEFKLLDGAIESIYLLRNFGFEIVVVTNQPDVARGVIDLKFVEDIHKQIQKSTKISNFYVCPHDDEYGCDCRKPRGGLLLQAAKDLNLDLTKCFLIGDRWKDIQAGQEVGCQCFFINYKYAESVPSQPFSEVQSLSEATKIILKDFL